MEGTIIILKKAYFQMSFPENISHWTVHHSNDQKENKIAEYRTKQPLGFTHNYEFQIANKILIEKILHPRRNKIFFNNCLTHSRNSSISSIKKKVDFKRKSRVNIKRFENASQKQITDIIQQQTILDRSQEKIKGKTFYFKNQNTAKQFNDLQYYQTKKIGLLSQNEKIISCKLSDKIQVNKTKEQQKARNLQVVRNQNLKSKKMSTLENQTQLNKIQNIIKTVYSNLIQKRCLLKKHDTILQIKMIQMQSKAKIKRKQMLIVQMNNPLNSINKWSIKQNKAFRAGPFEYEKLLNGKSPIKFNFKIGYLNSVQIQVIKCKELQWKTLGKFIIDLKLYRKQQKIRVDQFKGQTVELHSECEGECLLGNGSTMKMWYKLYVRDQ